MEMLTSWPVALTRETAVTGLSEKLRPLIAWPAVVMPPCRLVMMTVIWPFETKNSAFAFTLTPPAVVAPVWAMKPAVAVLGARSTEPQIVRASAMPLGTGLGRWAFRLSFFLVFPLAQWVGVPVDVVRDPSGKKAYY
ncbi:MAG: hypothetical protein K2V38_13910, partial [Gemmataceae bacterium]|nr:hypothetical protein [Gemmataceae bacterium]